MNPDAAGLPLDTASGGNEGGSDDGGGSDGDDGDDGSAAQCGEALSIGATPMRRLTRAQYEHSIRDLLGVDIADVDLPDDGNMGLFATNSQFTVSASTARGYMVAAEAAADRVALDRLGDCAADAIDAPDLQRPCAEQMVSELGGRIMRRPVEAQLADSLLSVFDVTAAEFGFEVGLRRTLAAMLQQPDFLYFIEYGEPERADGSVMPLTGYEIATRLSYMLWTSTPDDALLAAAAAGELQTDAGIETQVRRLLADAKAGDALDEFHGAWLGAKDLASSQKSAEKYPQFDDAIVAAMAEERRRFVEDVIGNGGTVEDLFTAKFTYVNDVLADLYGIEEQPEPTEAWRRVPLVDGRRQGILTQGGVLAAHAGPVTTPVIKRGRFILTDVACEKGPPLPPNFIPSDPVPIQPGLNPRQQWEQGHAFSEDGCRTCHEILDPLGWPFDNFDAVGQWRDTLRGFDIDASAIWPLQSTELGGKEVDGAVELTNLLGASDQGRNCYAKQWVTFATDRIPTVPGPDVCSVEALLEQFEQSGGTIEDLLVKITLSPMFRNTPEISS